MPGAIAYKGSRGSVLYGQIIDQDGETIKIIELFVNQPGEKAENYVLMPSMQEMVLSPSRQLNIHRDQVT